MQLHEPSRATVRCGLARQNHERNIWFKDSLWTNPPIKPQYTHWSIGLSSITKTNMRDSMLFQCGLLFPAPCRCERGVACNASIVMLGAECDPATCTSFPPFLFILQLEICLGYFFEIIKNVKI
jgi:hypothetical protein